MSAALGTKGSEYLHSWFIQEWDFNKGMERGGTPSVIMH